MSQVSFSYIRHANSVVVLFPKKEIFSKSIKGTSKKLKNIQCFRFAICYCGIFQKSGMSDIYFRSDDKVLRLLHTDL